MTYDTNTLLIIIQEITDKTYEIYRKRTMVNWSSSSTLSDTLLGSVSTLLLVLLSHLGSMTMVASSNGGLSLLTVEKGGSLLEGATLSLDDEQVDEDEFKEDPTAVHDLMAKSATVTRFVERTLT